MRDVEFNLTGPALWQRMNRAVDRIQQRLERTVRMKLNAFRDKDRMHLRDMLDVKLIDADWPRRFPSPLRERLQHLIDHPE